MSFGADFLYRNTVSIRVLVEWIDVKDLVHFDTAVCNQEMRPYLLLRHAGFIHVMYIYRRSQEVSY